MSIVDPTNPLNPGYGDKVKQLVDEIKALKTRINALETRELRVGASETVSQLPAAATRAGRVLAFDSLGQPTTAVLIEGSAAGLANQYAGTGPGEGASLIGTVTGETVQEFLDRTSHGRLIGNRLLAGFGTYTPTPGTEMIEVIMCGAGGPGGRTASTAANQFALSGNGSSGAYVRFLLAGSLTGFQYSVGLGGIGAFGATPGNPGEDTVFGIAYQGGDDFMVARGGQPGLSPNAFVPAARQVEFVPGVSSSPDVYGVGLTNPMALVLELLDSQPGDLNAVGFNDVLTPQVVVGQGGRTPLGCQTAVGSAGWGAGTRGTYSTGNTAFTKQAARGGHGVLIIREYA